MSAPPRRRSQSGNKKAFPSCGKGRKEACPRGQVAGWRRMALHLHGTTGGSYFTRDKKRPFPVVRKVFFAYNLPFSPPEGNEKHVYDNISKR